MEATTQAPILKSRTTVRTTFEFPADFARAIKMHAAAHDLTMNDIVTQGVRLILANSGPLSPADAAVAELRAVAAEIGPDRAIAILREAQRSAAA